jgi:hypothetical protein
MNQEGIRHQIGLCLKLGQRSGTLPGGCFIFRFAEFGLRLAIMGDRRRRITLDRGQFSPGLSGQG